MQARNRRKTQAGSNFLEFTLLAMPLVGLLIGVTTTGLALGRSVQVAQVCRDAASMFVRSVDFTKTGNQDLLIRLARGLNLTRTGGNAVIIFSKVTWISAAKCTALGNPSGCNANQHVITQRVVVGNSSMRSNLGTPGSVASDGNVNNYTTDDSAIAQFPMMTLDDGQYAYIAEARFPGFLDGRQVYSRAIF